MKDKINPDYYVGTRIQVSDFISEFNLNYFEGNIVKYITRHRKKGSGPQDIKKVIHYAELILELVYNEKP